VNPAVLIYRSDLLPPSETFVAAQAHALRRFSPCFAGLRLVPAGLPLDPCETVVLTRNDNLSDKLRRRLYFHTGIAPQFVRALRLRRPALLHAHFAIDAAAALPLQAQLNIPLIVTFTATTPPAPTTPYAGARRAASICAAKRSSAPAHAFSSASLNTSAARLSNAACLKRSSVSSPSELT